MYIRECPRCNQRKWIGKRHETCADCRSERRDEMRQREWEEKKRQRARRAIDYDREHPLR